MYLLWLFISVLFYAVSEYLSKKWALDRSNWLIVCILFFYVTSSAMWLPAIASKNSLVLCGIIWLILATMATIGIGVFIYHEPLTWYQYVGLSMALVAMVLLSV